MDFDTCNYNEIEWQLIVKGSETLENKLKDHVFQPLGELYDRLFSVDALRIFNIASIKEILINKLYKIYNANFFEYPKLNETVIDYYLTFDRLNKKLEKEYGMATYDFDVVRIDMELTTFSSGNIYCRFKYFIKINDIYEYFTFEMHELLSNLRIILDEVRICPDYDIKRFNLENRPNPMRHFLDRVNPKIITVNHMLSIPKN